jgi:hypothetical protein
MPDATKVRLRVVDSDVEMAEAIADALVSLPPVDRHRRGSTASASSGHLSVPASEMDSDVEQAPTLEAARRAKVCLPVSIHVSSLTAP